MTDKYFQASRAKLPAKTAKPSAAKMTFPWVATEARMNRLAMIMQNTELRSIVFPPMANLPMDEH